MGSDHPSSQSLPSTNFLKIITASCVLPLLFHHFPLLCSPLPLQQHWPRWGQINLWLLPTCRCKQKNPTRLTTLGLNLAFKAAKHQFVHLSEVSWMFLFIWWEKTRKKGKGQDHRRKVQEKPSWRWKLPAFYWNSIFFFFFSILIVLLLCIFSAFSLFWFN